MACEHQQCLEQRHRAHVSNDLLLRLGPQGQLLHLVGLDPCPVDLFVSDIAMAEVGYRGRRLPLFRRVQRRHAEDAYRAEENLRRPRHVAGERNPVAECEDRIDPELRCQNGDALAVQFVRVNADPE